MIKKEVMITLRKSFIHTGLALEITKVLEKVNEEQTLVDTTAQPGLAQELLWRQGRR